MTKKARRFKRIRDFKHWSMIANATGVLMFLNQIASKDWSTINSQSTWMAKGQTIANVITGRIFGMNFFGGPQYTQTINPGGMANKWTALGIFGTFVYGYIPKAPEKGKVRMFAKRSLIAGLLGGLFDAPAGAASYRTGGGARAGPQMVSGASANPALANPGFR